MQFKVQWSDCEVDIDNYVGFAQDKEGMIWYFSEHGEQFTISEYGIYSESNEAAENSGPFTVFNGTITIGN